MQQYKWLIVGPGQIAKDFANDLTLVQHSSHSIEGVVGRSLEDAQQFANEHNVQHAFDSLEKAIGADHFDCVYIATPHPLHHRASIACLEKNISVLCEKPAAMNVLQLKEIVDASEKNNTFFMEGMWIRFLPIFKKVKAILDSGVLGNINSIRAEMSYKAPYDHHNRYFDPQLGGGSLLDLGVYGIFLSMALLGDPEKIHAHAKLTKYNIDESTAFILQYSEGRYALMESSFIKQTNMDAFIYADNGFIQIRSPWLERSPGIIVNFYEEGKQQQHFEMDWEGRGFQFEIEAMIRSIESKKIEVDELSHQFSLSMMKVTEAIREQTGIQYPTYGE